MDYKVVVTRDAEEDLESFMSNPWKDISLSDYENHMSLDSVMQLQSMNQTMKSQLEDYDVHTVMILGIAGFANMWFAVFADSGVAVLCIINSIRILKKKY